MSALLHAETVWGLVAARAAATPDAAILQEPDGTLVRAGALAERAERVAAGLQALGISAGTTVTWQLPTRVETVLLSLALARLGAVQTPVIHLYGEREVAAVLRSSRPAALVVPRSWKGEDRVAAAERLTARLEPPCRVIVADRGDLPDGDPVGLPPPPVDGGEVRWIYYTSGTTSEPKGVRHTDATLLAGGRGLALALDLQPDDKGSMAFPFAHIAGPDYLLMLLAVGVPAVLLESFVPAEAVATYRRLGVTMVGGSTAHYTAFLAEQRRSPAAPIIPTLRTVSGGGAPKPAELVAQVRDELGAVLVHGYGMTEIPMISQGSPHDSTEQLMHTEGAPVAGVELRVVRSDGEPAASGEEGEVRVRGSVVCAGYTDPALTSAAFDAEGWFRTGDLGVLREDGHVRLTGRLKDVIIRKGENVSAQELEDLLYSHPKVAEVAVVGLPDAERGELVCAVVTTPAASAPLTLPELVDFLAAAGLMRQKIPERLEVVESLPRNETLNKVLKYKLRERFSGGTPAPQ